ncbi:MAG: iron ABC transporter permease [Treponema sp.]|nr:iron ABC transporter permease [Treponema sp.]
MDGSSDRTVMLPFLKQSFLPRRSSPTETRFRSLLIPALIPLGAVAAGFLFPYAAVLAAGISKSFDASMLNRNLASLVFFTVKQALFSCLAALVLGLPGAWFLALSDNRTGVMRLLSGIPFAMPSILVVLGFVLFYGNSGWLNRITVSVFGLKEAPFRILYRPEAIILAHGFYNFPLVIRLLGDGLREAGRGYAKPALSLGASPFLCFVTVLLPLALPSLMASLILTFLYSFTSFAVVLVLGGGAAASTLAVEIYRYARISLDLSGAGLLALLETIIAAGAFGLYLFFDRMSLKAGPERREETEAVRHGGLFRSGMMVCLVFTACFSFGPILSIPVESLLQKPSRSGPAEWSLRWWQSLGDSVLPALGRSLVLALLSASIACILGILAAGAWRGMEQEKKGSALFLRGTMTSPLFSSGIVLSLGWLILYGRGGSRTIFSAAMLHAIIALPFVFSSLAQGLLSLSDSMLKAAETAGAGPLVRLFTVAIPCAGNRLRSAWAFAAIVSLGELNAVMMLGMEKWETLPLLIYRAAGAYRYGAACAAGTVLMAVMALVFALAEFPFTGRKRREYGN